jgi:hypothetical protein
MSFDFRFGPPWPAGAVTIVAGADRVTRTDRAAGCFAANNAAYFTQTVQVSLRVRIMTGVLRRPFNFIHVETDSTASGRVEAAALPGYAQGSVEASVNVMDTSLRVLSTVRPIPFARALAPAFYGMGFPFSGVTVFADTAFSGTGVTGPLIVDVRIDSWATAVGWANAAADLQNACVTQIHVFSS